MIEGIAESVILWLVPACPQSQRKSPVADLIQRIGHLRQQRRIAERGTGHQWPKLNALCRRSYPAEESEHLPRAIDSHVRETIEQVVSQPEGVKPNLFSDLRHLLNITEAWCAPIRSLGAKRSLA